MRTFGDMIAGRNPNSSGFDYLRLVLALLVMVFHSGLIAGEPALSGSRFDGLTTFRISVVLPMFFALSGFLVTGSLVRVRNVGPFLMMRILRILPALLVEVVVSALVIGPLFTEVPLTAYFGSGDFGSYFLNILGWPHYVLPGVFLHNPFPRIVNGSLWTVPFEGECYIVMAGLAISGLWRRRDLLGVMLALLLVSLCGLNLFVWTDDNPGRGLVEGRQLILFFLCGVVLFLYRDRVAKLGVLFIASVVLAAFTVSSHRWFYVSILPVTYATLYLGLTNPPRLPLILSGDYSYGLYLYACPIQQSIQWLLPGSSSWMNFIASLPIAAACAVLSWHHVERPFLRLKRFYGRAAPPSVTSPDDGLSRTG